MMIIIIVTENRHTKHAEMRRYTTLFPYVMKMYVLLSVRVKPHTLNIFFANLSVCTLHKTMQYNYIID